MTAQQDERSTTTKALRRLLAPVMGKVDAVRNELLESRRRIDELAARFDQLSRQTERLEAYQQVSRDEVERAFTSLTTELSGSTPDQSPGEILQRRLDHALLHAEALNAETRDRVERDLAGLRSTIRLTQAVAERAAAAVPAPAAAGGEEASTADQPGDQSSDQVNGRSSGVSGTPSRDFEHAVPSFDLLYRAFEDRHRGDPEWITERQRDDYLEVLAALPNPDLPIADLGCGRGELVRLLVDEGHVAVGVDSNLGQVVDGEPGLFVESDLFDWLDAREDASVRAVVAMHVVEHLPLDLQIRLVFEARRVLADGGLLVLETPNTLSVSTAATNFWVDPTHQRPVHPLFLEFLAEEAGFREVASKPLHELPVSFRGGEGNAELVEDLNSLILGAGDLALMARR